MAAGGYGKRFEASFRKSCERAGFLIERFQDSNKFGMSNSTRFTMNSPCDFLLFGESSLFYFELKSTETGSVSFNQPPYEKTTKTVSIKPHQINSLLARSAYFDVYAGLIIDFADRQKKNGDVIEGGTYYISVDKFVTWAKTCGKCSINKRDAESIGIEISRQKKKVNYTYDIERMLKKIMMEECHG